MGKFNVTSMRYLDPEHFRVLLAVEMGMKNHELVPLPLISSVAAIHRGATSHTLSDLAKLSLVAYERGKRYDGYRLTNLGYDFLALRALCARDIVGSVGNQIGIGKESDVFVGGDPDLNDVVLKFHRLGRTCFRKLKEKRDYHQRRHYCSWLYLSRIAALKEFTFLKALHARKFPVPEPIDICRHVVVMGLVDGLTLCHVDTVREPGRLYDKLMQIIVRLANYGMIHGDINEFNIILTKDEDPIIIDFPQMVSIEHVNAEFYFDRDVNGVRAFFLRKFHFEGAHWPCFSEIERRHNLDVEMAASGFTKRMELDLNRAYDEGNFEAHKFEAEDDEEELNDDEEDEYADEVDEEDGEKRVAKAHKNRKHDDEDTAELEEIEREGESEKRRLRRENRFNNWLQDAKTQLEKTAAEELGDECPQLVEMDPAISAKYQEAYERVIVEVEKYKDIDENEQKSDDGEENEDERSVEDEHEEGRASRRALAKANLAAPKVSKAKSVYSNGSTIAPDEIKKRLLKEKGKVKKERLKAKGKQCAVSRGRRDNMHVIKEHEGWDVY